MRDVIVTDKNTLEHIQRSVQKHIGDKTFELPRADVHVVGISSGVDSSVTALVLKALHPETHFYYVFTDTGVEVEGTREAIRLIEEATGNPVTWMKPKLDLFEMISQQGNFLPSQRQRSCTSAAKMVPFTKFLKTIRAKYGNDAVICSHVGIRADEPGREGGKFNDNTFSFFPLRELGLGRREVFAILNETIGVPAYYVGKSRSGCGVCIFSRRAEIIQQIKSGSDLVLRASDLENLNQADKDRLRQLPNSVSADIRVTENHLTLPWPAEVFIDNPTPDQKMPWEVDRVPRANPDNQDLFGLHESKTFYVAVEYERYRLGANWQRSFNKIVSYSTSLGGIKTALKFWWKHRLDTREISLMSSEKQLRDECKIAVFEVVVNDHKKHLGVEHPEGVYTWQNDRQPLDVIRKTFAMLERILHQEGLVQEAKMGEIPSYREMAQTALKKLDCSLGEIVWTQVYDPPMESELTEDIDIETAPEACYTCSR